MRIVNEIATLATKFYKLKNKSMNDLLAETGYFNLFNQISEEKIKHELAKYPESIYYWILWSENKRTDQGWYLSIDNTKDKDYRVGYYRNGNLIKEDFFIDKESACASFIKNEIEDIRLEPR